MTNHRALVGDMLKYLHDVQKFTPDGREAFMHNVMAQYAVIYAYQTVGEIAKRLPETFRTEHSDINWRQLINFRDFLAHNYDRIVLGSLWTAVEALPMLIPALQELHDSLLDAE